LANWSITLARSHQAPTTHHFVSQFCEETSIMLLGFDQSNRR